MNPDNILFKTWFQVAASVAIGGIVVGVMTYRSGGRVTVNRATYEDTDNSHVIDRQDRYIRTTVTKRKIEKNNNNGGGGGGGRTGGDIRTAVAADRFKRKITSTSSPCIMY